VAPTLFTFMSIGIRFLEEVAKLRAARRVWAHLVRDRYGARDAASLQLRIFAFTAGSSLTAQQPLNNVARTAVEALAGALANVQTLHVCAYDEAVGTPTERAATLALRTQQVIAEETGVCETVDALGGSYAIEALTDELVDRVERVMAEVERRGGAVACIESGWFQDRIAQGAYEQARAVESGELPVIGVNRFRSESEPIEVFEVDPALEVRQAEQVRRLRRERDGTRVDRALERLERAARAGENVMPATIEAVAAYATVGEIVARLRGVHGAWSAGHGY
jgi:methylmalonyl-CoA mutase, N-terminal domain